MSTIIIQWMLNNKLATFLIGLLLVVGAYGAIQRSRLAIANATVASQKEAIATLEQAQIKQKLAVAELEKLLVEQRKSIAGHILAAEVEQRKADEARKRLDALRKQHQQELADLMNRPVPKDCEESVDWLGRQANEILEVWE